MVSSPARVLLAAEFPQVAVQMLGREFVEGSLMGSFQCCPERLHAVDVSHLFDVLPGRMLHDPVLPGQTLVGGGIVGIDLGRRAGVLGNEPLERFGVGLLDDLGPDPVGGPVPDTDHGGLACNTPARQGFPLGLGHVASAPPEVGFVDLDRSGEGLQAAGVPGLPESVEHEPGRLLGDLEVPGELHAGDALEVSDVDVDGEDPLAEGEPGTLQGRAGPDGEVVLAVPAPVGHRECVLDLAGVEASTPSAATAIGPVGGFEPALS